MTATLSTTLTPVLDCPSEDETFDPWCMCPDGMPCWCVAESRDPFDDRDY